MQKFKDILNDEELSNMSTVKHYLEYSFKRRKTKKAYKLYINICNIFERYPVTSKELLDNIPTLGYYKDYFYILMYSKNNLLDAYIYDIIIKQIRKDLDNLKHNKEITTLGKWLPREKSKINIECHFIDKFNKLFFPNITNKFTARNHYRKMKTQFNMALGTIESKMCTKQYDKIDYHKVAPYALKQAIPSLLKHEECKVGLDKYGTSILKKMSLSNFTKELFLTNYSNDKLELIWKQNKFIVDIKYVDNFNNTVCSIDLSNDTYNNHGEFFAIGMALLADFHLGKVYVGNNLVNLNGTIVEKAKQLLKYIGPCKAFDVVPSKDIKCFIFVTEKDIHYDNITYIHFNTNEVKYYNNNKVTKLSNNNIISVQKNNIHMITESGFELRDITTPKIIIFLLCMLLFVVRIYEKN